MLSPDDAVRDAVANARLDGGDIDPYWVRRLQQLAHGEVSAEDLIAEATAMANLSSGTEIDRLRAALQVCEHVPTRAEPTDAEVHAGQNAAMAWCTDWQPEEIRDDLPDFQYRQSP